MATSIIDKNSDLTTPNTLDLFSTLQTSVGEKCARFREVNLQHQLQNNGPFVFHVVSPHMVDLSRTYFTFTFRVLENGKPMPKLGDEEVDGKKIENPAVAPLNGIGNYFLSQIVLLVNGQLVEDSGNLLYFRAFCETELTMDVETKKCTLGDLIMYSTADNRTEKVDNPGYIERWHKVCDGQKYQCFTKLHIGLASQSKLLPPNTPLNFTFYRNNDQFCLLNFNMDQTKKPIYSIELDSVSLLVREVEIEQNLMLGIEKLLASGRKITYPIRKVECRNIFISAGRRDCPNNIISQTKPLPRRVIIALTNPKGFHGDVAHDPTCFPASNLFDVFVDAGTRSWPLKGWNLDYPNNQYGPAWLQFLEGLGFAGSSRNCGVTYKDFKDSRAIYCFDLSPNAQLNCFDLQEIGNVSIRLLFRETIPEPGLMCLVYLETNEVLSMDHARNITASNSV